MEDMEGGPPPTVNSMWSEEEQQLQVSSNGSKWKKQKEGLLPRPVVNSKCLEGEQHEQVFLEVSKKGQDLEIILGKCQF